MLQVFILTILSYFTKLAISEVSNNFYGGECEIIDDTIYYMGGQLNNELFEDIIYLNLNQNFTIYESNWHYLSISNKISMMYPNLISRGSNYNDIYFLSSNQKSNTGANNTNNFYFFNSKNQLFTKDSKSNLKASNDELLFPYLATWNKDPKDDDKFILYGGMLNNTTMTVDEDLFIYSNNERGWTNMKSNLYQDKRMDHCSIINQKDNAIYYLGGRYFNNTLIPLNHLLSLNTTSYEFTRVDLKGDLPKPRIGSKLVQLNENELLLLGGIYDTNYTQYSKELYILNLREFKWTKISNLNENNLIGYRPCIVNYYPYIIIAFGYTKNNNNKNLLLLNQNTLTFNSEFVPLSTNSLSMDNTTKGMPLYLILIISIASFLLLLALATIVVFYIKRRNNRKNKDNNSQQKALTETAMTSSDDINNIVYEWDSPDPIWEPNNNISNELQFQQDLFTLQHHKSVRYSKTLINPNIDMDDKLLPNPLSKPR